jgi:hypothetical protein
MRQQRFDFAAQGLVPCTGFFEEISLLVRLALQGRAEQFVDSLPSLGSMTDSDALGACCRDARQPLDQTSFVFRY